MTITLKRGEKANTCYISHNKALSPFCNSTRTPKGMDGALQTDIYEFDKSELVGR